jgi:[protein-PII] uridylyltransferase
MNDAVDQYKEKLLEILDTVDCAYSKDKSALDLLTYYTDAIDTLLINLWQDHPDSLGKYCLLAIGGYGRRELYPYSDIDILILTETPVKEDPILEGFLQTVWDLKLKASSITATREQLTVLCKQNLATLTSILDQRYLSGSMDLYHSFCTYSDSFLQLSPKEFYTQKKEEQQHRYHTVGHYAFSLEPNIKESPGGLRDMQTLLWCAQYAFIKQQSCFSQLAIFSKLEAENILTHTESQRLAQGYLYLAHVRFSLHLQTKKKEDRLSFEIQATLAERYGESQRDFMKKYYDAILTLLRYQAILDKSLCEWLNETIPLLHEGIGQSIGAGPRACPSSATTGGCPYEPMRILGSNEYPEENEILAVLLQCENDADIQKIPLPVLRTIDTKQFSPEKALTVENQRLFLKLLHKAPYVYSLLKTLRLWGVLGHYLPELKLAMGLIQHSLFHSYTVDEHTLLLTAMIDKFHLKSYQEKYPLCHELILNIQSPHVLYLAALLHDSGKGHLEDHSLAGEKLAITLCHRLSSLLNTEEQSNLIWLVKNHLLMSIVAQKQDIHDPTVIIAFAKEVENLNRLKLLYLLTVADISATNPTLWNSWKDSLLKKLYLATEKAVQRDYILSPADKKVAHKKEKSLLLLAKHSIENSSALALWQSWPDVYFLHHSVPSIVKHTALILKQKNDKAVFSLSDRAKQGHYELFIYCKDRPFLFSLFTNVLEKENLNVVSADILTTTEAYALDSFYLLRDKAYSKKKEHLLLRLENALLELKDNKIAPIFKQRFHKKRLLPSMITEIHCRNKENQNVTEVEINSYDRPGLLAKIGLVFSEHKLNLHQAKIATLGQRIEDIFVVTNGDGTFLAAHEAKNLTDDLLLALRDL